MENRLGLGRRTPDSGSYSDLNRLNQLNNSRSQQVHLNSPRVGATDKAGLRCLGPEVRCDLGPIFWGWACFSQAVEPMSVPSWAYAWTSGPNKTQAMGLMSNLQVCRCFW